MWIVFDLEWLDGDVLKVFGFDDIYFFKVGGLDEIWYVFLVGNGLLEWFVG